MKTTEIIGPPGAGKTTYVDQQSSSTVYAGESDRARCLFEWGGIGWFARILPKTPRVTIGRKVFRVLETQFASEFFHAHPKVLISIEAMISEFDDGARLFRFLHREAAWYQLHSTTLATTDTYMIDDGLYQFHLRLLAFDDWKPEDVIEHLPKPDSIVFIDAPAETCLIRQESRKRGRASKLEGLSRPAALERIEEDQQRASKLADTAEQQGIKVVRINTS